ncbi:hypothetical protein KOW79_010377 [Hemibagrus wyckioides]|uniref:Uncharacterized protein n=1 Tax=Hemibagrus wyckioides TaxID=337641 RepID=A0A9D3SJM5_9TELE|nr:hypothetical protein KOW79_010377 [Hemibagrus wyckioides]
MLLRARGRRKKQKVKIFEKQRENQRTDSESLSGKEEQAAELLKAEEEEDVGINAGVVHVAALLVHRWDGV